MFLNTYEHGYHDAISGKQRVYGSTQYRQGYHEGEISKARQRRSTIMTAVLSLVAALMMGGVMALALAEAAGRLPV